MILHLLSFLVKFQESNQQFRNRFVLIHHLRIGDYNVENNGKTELVISHSTSSFIITRSPLNTHALTALPYFHFLPLKESVEQ